MEKPFFFFEKSSKRSRKKIWCKNETEKFRFIDPAENSLKRRMEEVFPEAHGGVGEREKLSFPLRAPVSVRRLWNFHDKKNIMRNVS